MEDVDKIDNKTTDNDEVMTTDEPDQPAIEEETPSKPNNEVDDAFLCSQAMMPPAKSVRKRHHRKSSKNKLPETSEIEKDGNQLSKADNESEGSTRSAPIDKNALLKAKLDKRRKRVLGFFGGDSDSEYEEDTTGGRSKDSWRSAVAAYDSKLSKKKSMQEMGASCSTNNNTPLDSKPIGPRKTAVTHTVTSGAISYPISSGWSSDEDLDDHFPNHETSKDNNIMTFSITKIKSELEELKQHKQRIKRDMFNEENLNSQQKFQQMFRNIDQDIQIKEVEYQGLLALQNTNDTKKKANKTQVSKILSSINDQYSI